MKDAGKQIAIICKKLTPAGSMIEIIAAIAAEIGDPEIATCEATTAADKGLDGLSPISFATSEITGRVEKNRIPCSCHYRHAPSNDWS